MSEATYACVDVGTTRIKLALYDDELHGKLAETLSVPVGSDGLQDAEELFRAVRHLVKRGKELGATSVGLSTYRGSTVAWDREGKPLTPIVTWTDRGSTLTYRRLPAYVRLMGKVPPLDLIISPYSPVLKFLRLRELNPSLAEDAMMWTVDAYLAYRLTGKLVSDATNACLSGVIDPRSMKEIGVVRSLFKLRMETPRLVENTEHVGEYDGVEVNALVADQQAASVAEWAVEGGVGKVTNGTGTFVDIPTSGFARRGELIPLVLLKHKGKVWFGVEGYLPTSGRAVDTMMAMGVLRDYADLEVRPAGDVIFVPALAGLQVPRAPQAKGVIAGLTLGSDRAAVVSGLLKSIAFHVRLVLEQSGERTQILRADGGLSKSNALLKAISAATKTRVERDADTEATARGLAMLQLVSTGKSSFEGLVRANSEREVFSETGDAKLEEEYEKWKNLTGLLKSSKGSYLAE
ncbi:MAG TPA: FGGY-family carbohydrate kinase [Nitrososphaerales archaeon]|nr:FGGY-family carbohydrate kinase [Nitrososphaerales archaeon]